LYFVHRNINDLPGKVDVSTAELENNAFTSEDKEKSTEIIEDKEKSTEIIEDKQQSIEIADAKNKTPKKKVGRPRKSPQQTLVQRKDIPPVALLQSSPGNRASKNLKDIEGGITSSNSNNDFPRKLAAAMEDRENHAVANEDNKRKETASKKIKQGQLLPSSDVKHVAAEKSENKILSTADETPKKKLGGSKVSLQPTLGKKKDRPPKTAYLSRERGTKNTNTSNPNMFVGTSKGSNLHDEAPGNEFDDTLDDIHDAVAAAVINEGLLYRRHDNENAETEESAKDGTESDKYNAPKNKAPRKIHQATSGTKRGRPSKTAILPVAKKDENENVIHSSKPKDENVIE